MDEVAISEYSLLWGYLKLSDYIDPTTNLVDMDAIWKEYHYDVSYQDMFKIYGDSQKAWNATEMINAHHAELRASSAYDVNNMLRTYAGKDPVITNEILDVYNPAGSSVVSGSDSALELASANPANPGGGSVYTSSAMGGMGGSDAATAGGKLTNLLSLDVGLVGAAAAPILGVALGANLYQRNPEFWTKLSQRLLPFCYPGTTKIPAWLDVVESALQPGTYEAHTVIDANIISELQSFFEEEGVGQGDGVISDLDTSPVIQPIPTYQGGYEAQFTYNNKLFKAVLTLSDSARWCVYKTSSEYSTLISSPSSGSLGRFAVSEFNNGRWIEFTNTTIGAPSSNVFIYDGRTAYYTISGFLGGAYVANGVISALGLKIVNNGAAISFITQSMRRTSWTMLYGTERRSYPTGTSQWTGDQGSTTPYDKKIIYMIEDPNNPGTWIIDPQNGVEIALPTNALEKREPVTEELEKPVNWPEDVPWPMVIAFPWEKPAEYDGDWPETMPWPLPPTQPDWWPSIVPYPTTFSYPVPTNDPETEPDPNTNVNNNYVFNYIDNRSWGDINPTVEVTPDPIENPSEQPQPQPVPINPVINITITQPVDSEGETPTPVLPTIPLQYDATNPGLITVYHPTDAQLKAFASWLWVTYADPSIAKLWNNPFDGVISLMEIYCTPTDVGHKNIRSGFLDSGVDSNYISRYTEINCGSITVPEYYRNYLDYSPYSKCYCYLPFIGIVELNVDDIVGHAVNITYKIDEYNGACIAQITVARVRIVDGEEVSYSNLAYQFSGNCAVELPLAGGSQSAIRAGMIQAAAYGLASVVGGIVTGAAGNIGGAISQIGYGAANAIGSLASAKSSVQHSGSFGSSYGALGVKRPYIIVSRPQKISVPNYFDLYGFPAHKAVTIGNCTGYIRVIEVNVKSATASDKEKQKIEELLKEGVYVD